MVKHANFTACSHHTFHFIALWLLKVDQSVKLHRQSSCAKCTKATGDTNLDLKSSGFIPIAGILELVNRTLVNGVPLLTWREKRGEDERENRRKGNK